MDATRMDDGDQAAALEEKTLVSLHGDDYRQYQSRVPMLLPFAERKGR